MNDQSTHDTALCECGYSLCSCSCERCQTYRDRDLELKRMSDVLERLAQLDIHPYDLACIVYPLVADKLRAQIEEVAYSLACQHMQNLLSQDELRETLAELLFDDMVKIAIGVQQGAKTNGRIKARTRG